tara:strand:- start:278 stop:580 length:303 start_codon:yes stop_codon:yes gene_type:complete
VDRSNQPLVLFHKSSGVKELVDARPHVDSEMVIAFWTNLQVFGKFRCVNLFLAAFAFDPDFSRFGKFLTETGLFFDFIEPVHEIFFFNEELKVSSASKII